MTPRRVPKGLEQRLHDCRTHLRFLQDACNQAISGDIERYKQVAAELRILVCETRTNRPLLLDLIDELGFACPVQAPTDGPPVWGGIQAVSDWQEVLDRSEEVRIAIAAGDQSRLDEIRQRHEAENPGELPLRDFVNKGLAYFIRPRQFSCRDVVW